MQLPSDITVFCHRLVRSDSTESYNFKGGIQHSKTWKVVYSTSNIQQNPGETEITSLHHKPITVHSYVVMSHSRNLAQYGFFQIDFQIDFTVEEFEIHIGKAKLDWANKFFSSVIWKVLAPSPREITVDTLG